jgi:hypothetical protein
MGGRRLLAGMAVVAVLAVATACDGESGGGITEEPASSRIPAASTTSTAFAGAGTSGTDEPAFTGEGREPFCAELATVDPRFAELPMSGQPDAVRSFFTLVHEKLSALAGSAPPEVSGDLTVVVGAYRQLLDGLGEVDFDPARLPPEVSRTFESPEVRTAGARLEAYKRTVCGQGG